MKRSESEEDDDDDDDERDCGKNSDDRANKNRPSMSVVKLDDKQKKGINSYKRNDSESENDSDREATETERTKGMRRGKF
jgi:hypothetical protein